MVSYFTIYRPLNLLFIIIAQLLCAFFLDSNTSLNDLYDGGLPILILGTTAIVSYGYWINDFLDKRRDRINRGKPKSIEYLPDVLVYIHLLLFLSIALWTGRYLGVWFLSLFFITLLLLSLYSLWLKNTPLLGNITIASLHSVCLFAVYKLFPSIDFLLIIYFAVLAGCIALAREIVKDLEDQEGDRLTGGQTIPISLGQNTANISVYIILLFTLSFSLVSYYAQKDYFQTPLLYVYYAYVAIFIVFPLYKIAVDVRFAKEKEEYTKISLWLKYVTFVGILSILFF